MDRYRMVCEATNAAVGGTPTTAVLLARVDMCCERKNIGGSLIADLSYDCGSFRVPR